MERRFQDLLGEWPEVYERPGGDGYRLEARHVSPASIRNAKTASLVLGWGVALLIVLTRPQAWIAAAIAGLVIVFVGRLLLRRAFHVTLKMNFINGGIEWIGPDMRHHMVRPGEERWLREAPHHIGEEEARKQAEAARRRAKAPPRIFQDSWEVFVDSGLGRRNRQIVAEIANDPAGNRAHLLHTALEFVKNRAVEDAEHRGLSETAMAWQPELQAWTPGALLQAVLAWRTGAVGTIAGVVAICLLVVSNGTPHLRITYEYRGTADRPIYLRCGYFGVQGWRPFLPNPSRDETCPLIKFMPIAFSAAAMRGELITPKSTALNEEKIDPLYWGVIAGSCLVRPAPGCERVKRLVVSGDYNIIQCAYGPLNNDGTGFRTFSFWHDKVPDDPLGYGIKGDDHPFLVLGKMAVAKCPATVGEVEPVFQASRLFPAGPGRP